jgi:hypothetical protein
MRVQVKPDTLGPVRHKYCKIQGMMVMSWHMRLVKAGEARSCGHNEYNELVEYILFHLSDDTNIAYLAVCVLSVQINSHIRNGTT